MRISDWSSDVCSSDLQAGCILSWQSFAEPADPASIQTVFDESTGLTGKPRKGTHMLCVNPLTGAPDTKAVASQNLGTLKPNEDMSDAELIPAAVPARCDERGRSEERRVGKECVRSWRSRGSPDQ